MALIPLNIPLTNEWLDITDLLTDNFDNATGIQFYLPYEHTKTLEILVDTSGTVVIGEAEDNTGTKLDRYFLQTSTRFYTTYKYYARALETIATLSVKDLGNVVSIEGVGTYRGALNVHDADVHTEVINKLMHQHTDIVTTLTTPTAGDGSEYQIGIQDATGFTDGDYIHINTTTIETTHPVLLSSVPALPTTGPAVFTLDRRLDRSHIVGDEVRKSIVNMALQIGTLAAPQEYWIAPPPGEVWHITRLLFYMTHDLSGDLGKFGGIPALTNGILLRAKINGQYGTLSNWKTNGDMKTDMFDVVFDARSGGQGDFGTSGRGTFKEAGVVIRLDGDTNDRIELYVQDDITSIISFMMKMQGHKEGKGMI